MEKEFIPYEQALALKQLGFDESCFMYYGEKNVLRIFTIDIKDLITNSELPPQYNTCPTFSQAFRWFREKHGIFSSIWCFETEQKFFIEFGFGIHKFEVVNKEEAQLECLKKLIEIVKNK